MRSGMVSDEIGFNHLSLLFPPKHDVLISHLLVLAT
jgi:hypothetical protein